MRLTVLVSNKEGKCEGEHGLSYFIEDDKRVLLAALIQEYAT